MTEKNSDLQKHTVMMKTQSDEKERERERNKIKVTLQEKVTQYIYYYKKLSTKVSNLQRYWVIYKKIFEQIISRYYKV